jgi:hypothetical protein
MMDVTEKAQDPERRLHVITEASRHYLCVTHSLLAVRWPARARALAAALRGTFDAGWHGAAPGRAARCLFSFLAYF